MTLILENSKRENEKSLRDISVLFPNNVTAANAAQTFQFFVDSRFTVLASVLLQENETAQLDVWMASIKDV